MFVEIGKMKFKNKSVLKRTSDAEQVLQESSPVGGSWQGTGVVFAAHPESDEG